MGRVLQNSLLIVVALIAMFLAIRVFTLDTSLAESAVATPPAGETMSFENDILLRSNERLLQLVQWTIGLVITVAVVMASFGWVQYRRNIEQDKQQLSEHKQELSEGIAKQSTAIEAELGVKIRDIDSRLASIRDIQERLSRLETSTAVALDRTEQRGMDTRTSEEIAKSVIDFQAEIRAKTTKTILSMMSRHVRHAGMVGNLSLLADQLQEFISRADDMVWSDETDEFLEYAKQQVLTFQTRDLPVVSDATRELLRDLPDSLQQGFDSKTNVLDELADAIRSINTRFGLDTAGHD